MVLLWHGLLALGAGYAVVRLVWSGDIAGTSAWEFAGLVVIFALVGLAIQMVLPLTTMGIANGARVGAGIAVVLAPFRAGWIYILPLLLLVTVGQLVQKRSGAILDARGQPRPAT